MQVRDSSTVVPVRRRRSIFTIIGMIVVLIVVLVLVYFAYVGWTSKGKPVPDVDMKTSAVDQSAPGALPRPGILVVLSQPALQA